VLFGIAASEEENGRRLSVDPLPGRDLAVVQDFGREPRTFTFEAFIVGPGYADRAQALVDVCADRNTPGALSLTYIGTVVVRPKACIRRERSDELGMVRFQLSFVECEVLKRPARKTSGLQSLDTAAAAVSKAAGDAVETGLLNEGVPNGVLTAAGDEVAKAGAALQVIGAVRDSGDKAASLLRQANALIRDAQALVLEPLLLAANLSNAIEQVAAALGNALASLKAYEDLATLVPDVHVDQFSKTNSKLVSDATHFAAVAGWARAAARVDWPSYEEAVEARRKIEADLDVHEGDVSDPIFMAICELRARLALQVPPADKKLPHLRELVLPCSRSAITVAYRLYDDVRRDQEIVDRNHVKHPSFLSPAYPLQVLIDA
jgi:prophage DNA circulation protein